MAMLNLEAALELYDLLGPYLPIGVDGFSNLGEYSQIIINNLRASDPAAYPKVLCLMSGKSMDELQQMSTSEIVEIFLRGITENRVEALRVFAEEIGYGG